MTPLEKAARALIDLDPTISGYHDTHIAMKLPATRAVLQAIREPSKAMLDKGITAAEEVEDWTQDSFERYRVDAASDMPLPVWQAMIDAALSE